MRAEAPAVMEPASLERILSSSAPREPAQLVEQGLTKLVLTLVEILRKVLEKQALRKMEDGDLAEGDAERVGMAFIEIRRKVRALASQFGVPQEDLDINLGSLLRVRGRPIENISLTDVVDKLLEKGTVACGQVKVSVAGVDLVSLNLLASLS